MCAWGWARWRPAESFRYHLGLVQHHNGKLSQVELGQIIAALLERRLIQAPQSRLWESPLRDLFLDGILGLVCVLNAEEYLDMSSWGSLGTRVTSTVPPSLTLAGVILSEKYIRLLSLPESSIAVNAPLEY